MKYENVYWDWPSMQNDDHYPTILAIGDSWFWYPFPGGSLLNPLGRIVAKKGHYILALGNNGAEAYDYVYGKYRRSVKTALRLHGKDLSSVFISGGGNDFAGFNDLRPLLNDDCSSAENAAECFKPGEDEGTLNWLIRRTAENYRDLIGRILASSNTRTTIVMHNYDYAYPSGRGIFGKRGAWLKPALDDAKVPNELQHECIKHLIDRITVELKNITEIDDKRIFLIDSTKTLTASDWANELHPKPSGFKKIALQRWRPVLENIGLA
ncbi:MAG: hypothetical protein NZ524_05265 [Thiobacillaceae bacterium]|nr:hypothetical protein [Thiobacillaceae bacterium]MDW8323209.1 SGNH/GDSL hydrolase family protein [Burkholderiales bacterium]